MNNHKYSIKTNCTRSLLSCLIGGFLLLSSNSLWAAVVSADFREDLALPAFCVGDRVLESLGQTVGVGIELDDTDETSNPCTWNDSLQVDYDPATNLLTLTPTDSNQYQTIDINITNILFSLVGETVVGISEVSDNVMDIIASAPFSRSIAVGVGSISINYTVNDIPGSTTFEFSPSGSAVFQIELAGSVAPLPESIPTLSQTALTLLILMLLGLSMWQIRKINAY